MKISLKFVVFTFLATVNLTKAYADFPHAEPPPGDPCLTNRLGRSWSEPIYSGYLIADGKYIDAPYIVEQRGYKTMVNGEQVARIDPRIVLPLPPPEPVTEDPGIPEDLTRESSLGTMVMHPKTKAKRLYFDNIGLSGQERVEKMIEYFESLPCVSKVVDTGQPGGPKNSRNIRIYGMNGDDLSSNVRLAPKPSRESPSDKKIHEWTIRNLDSMKSKLERGALIFVRNGRVVAQSGYPDRQSERPWREIFEMLAKDIDGNEKVQALKNLGLLHRKDDLRRANIFFPVTYFKPTDQLWERLDGEEDWKQGAEEHLYNMTNSWQKITPSFPAEDRDSKNTPENKKRRVPDSSMRPMG